MENIIYSSIIIAVLFFGCKFIEFRFQDENERNDFKGIVKDSFIVFLASLVGIYLFDYLRKYINTSSLLENTEPVIFTDNPDF